MNTVNGITNNYNVMVLTFRDGDFEFFADEWNQYSIGSANIKVSQERAIEIAKERAQNRISEDVGKEAVLDYTFVSEHAFLTMQPRENVLIPHWEVLLGLDKLVLTYGAAFRVSVWADTGEIPYITYSGSYGVFPNEGNSATPPSSDQSESLQSPLSPSSPTSLRHAQLSSNYVCNGRCNNHRICSWLRCIDQKKKNQINNTSPFF